MLWLRNIQIFTLLALWLSTGVCFGRVFGPDFGRAVNSDEGVRVDRSTTYYPEEGGPMEGGCEGGGTKPMNPCKYLLPDAVAGITDCVVAATQRTGGSAPLYGCKTEVPMISQAVGKSIKVCFADVYAGSESVGRTGVNGKSNPSKFDIATRRSSPLTKRVDAASGGQVTCSGRVDNTQNKERDVKRDPEAAKPDSAGGGAPSGGGSPSSSPPQSESPSQKPVAADPPPAGSSKTPPDDPTKLAPGNLPKRPVAALPPPDTSTITKRPGGLLPGGGSGQGIGPLPGNNFAGPGATGKGSAAPSVGAVSSSGGGGIAGGGGATGGEPPVAEDSRSNRGSGSAAGGGGSGSGSGGSSGSEALTPFGKPLGDAKFNLESGAALGDAAADGGLPGNTDGVERDPASENSDGIGGKYSPDLFERIHSYFVRCQGRGGCVGKR